MLFELVAETVFFIAVWELYFIRTLMPKCHDWASKQPFWGEILRRRGALAKSGQSDLVLMMVLAAHHTTAGSILLLSTFLKSGFLWRHGALMELGYELADLYANIRGVWPYEKKKVPMDIRIGFALHHLPGITLLFPLIMNNYHENPHLQAIGGWLLFGAGISAWMGVAVYTRNFDDPTEMKQAATSQLVGTASFLFARWVIFPVESAAFLAELDTRTDISENFPMVSRAMLLSLSLFNLAVTFTIVPKAIRYIIKGFYSSKVSLEELNENEIKELALDESTSMASKKTS